MDDPSLGIQSRKPIDRRNWWKLAFWLAVLAFEGAREFAVLVNQSQPEIGGSLFIESVRPGRVIASGRWERIDGGDPILPILTSIDCRQELGSCVIADTVLWDKRRVSPPNIEIIDAKFLNHSISFVNESALCVKYTVRLDLNLEKAFSVREATKGSNGTFCEGARDRIEMQLVEPFKPGDLSKFDNHFLPILRIIRFVAASFR